MNETFENFNNISHRPLRVYNRVVTMNNLLSDFGKAILEKYIEQFTEVEKKELYIMGVFIKKFGHKKTKELVTAGMTFSQEDYEGEPVV